MRTLQRSRRHHGAVAAPPRSFAHGGGSVPGTLARAAVVLALACYFAAGSPPAAASPSFTVVMEGLDNPRGLTLAKTGPSMWQRPGVGGAPPAPSCAASHSARAAQAP